MELHSETEAFLPAGTTPIPWPMGQGVIDFDFEVIVFEKYIV